MIGQVKGQKIVRLIRVDDGEIPACNRHGQRTISMEGVRDRTGANAVLPGNGSDYPKVDGKHAQHDHVAPGDQRFTAQKPQPPPVHQGCQPPDTRKMSVTHTAAAIPKSNPSQASTMPVITNPTGPPKLKSTRGRRSLQRIATLALPTRTEKGIRKPRIHTMPATRARDSKDNIKSIQDSRTPRGLSLLISPDSGALQRLEETVSRRPDSVTFSCRREAPLLVSPPQRGGLPPFLGVRSKHTLGQGAEACQSCGNPNPATV